MKKITVRIHPDIDKKIRVLKKDGKINSITDAVNIALAKLIMQIKSD